MSAYRALMQLCFKNVLECNQMLYMCQKWSPKVVSQTANLRCLSTCQALCADRKEDKEKKMPKDKLAEKLKSAAKQIGDSVQQPSVESDLLKILKRQTDGTTVDTKTAESVSSSLSETLKSMKVDLETERKKRQRNKQAMSELYDRDSPRFQRPIRRDGRNLNQSMEDDHQIEREKRWRKEDDRQIEREKRWRKEDDSQIEREKRWRNKQAMSESYGHDSPRFQRPFRRDGTNLRPRGKEMYKLFDGNRLGIFSVKSEEDQRETQTDLAQHQEESPLKSEEWKSLWEIEEEEALERLKGISKNGFEEMITWTKEGKLWQFPINNEQGWKEEANVEFHEHLFLEDHISDFPQTGPIRHFMELVITGLSQNPYITVQQKREHIDWFRQYFIEKQKVLEEALGKDGIMGTLGNEEEALGKNEVIGTLENEEASA